MLKQSLKASKLFQHRFDILSTRFNNVERGWQTLSTLPFNKIERMLKPFAGALTRDIQCESLLRMRQSVIWYNESNPNPNNGSKTMYSLTNNNVLCYKKTENVLRQIRKTTKNHPLEGAKKFVETYSSSNAAAHDPEERVQLHKPRHYTMYKCKRKRRNERRGRLTDLEWLKSPAKALDTSWRTPTTTCEPLHRVVRIIILFPTNSSNVRKYLL